MANYILDDKGYFLGIVDNELASHTKISESLPEFTDTQRCKWNGNKWLVEDSKDLIDAKAEYDANQYQRTRATEYPALSEQFDLLFHDMTAGKGTKSGNWYKAVNKVKTDNPKPE